MDCPVAAWVLVEPGLHLLGMDTDRTAAGGLEPLQSIKDLADYLGIRHDHLLLARGRKGPCGIRVGRHVKFAVSDVRDWLAQQREARPGQSRSDRTVEPG